MEYINKRTNAVIVTKNPISGDDWIKVEKKAVKKTTAKSTTNKEKKDG